MIEITWAAWGWFLLAILLSSHAMVRVAALMPWSDAARQVRLPLFFGLALAPFAVGFLGIFCLSALGGSSHELHRGVMLGVLAALNVALLCYGAPGQRSARRPYDAWEKAAILLLVLFIAALLFNSAAYPLMQNDPLEYATVGRALFESRDLAIYPLIDTMNARSGFYGPWTHPPLYVALIYVANLMQNHADMPGLMRLISPWAAIVCCTLIVGLGSLSSRRAGLFSALWFLCAPLYFIGASSAVIDILPVLGITLLATTLIALNPMKSCAWVWQGSVLGIALWTHSQAILFIPIVLAGLVLVHGVARWRSIILAYTGILLVALLFAAWPFLHNMQTFGALISDEPLVFALPSLDWATYFQLNRGLNSTTAIIQYGVFKGWFAPIAYGGLFWLTTVAVCCYFVKEVRHRRLMSVIVNGAKDTNSGLPLLSAGLWVTYLGGVVLSVILGIDLMIRNERYMLVVLPFLSLMCGWFLDTLIRAIPSKRNLRHVFLSNVAVALLLAIPLHIFIFLVYPAVEYQLTRETLFQSQKETLAAISSYKAMAYLDTSTPKDSVVLAGRPADMYYSHRRMISYLDPVLLPFYAEKDPQRAVTMLRALGVNYIQVPDYPLPPVYNSTWETIIGDPSLTELEFSTGGNQIYRLRVNESEDVYVDEIPLNTSWSASDQWILGGRKQLYRIQLEARPFVLGDLLVRKMPYSLWQRDISAILQTVVPFSKIDSNAPMIDVEPNQEYRLSFDLEGNGYIEVAYLEYNASQLEVRTQSKDKVESLLLTGALLKKGQPHHVVRRLRTLEGTQHLALAIEQYGNSSTRVTNLRLERIGM